LRCRVESHLPVQGPPQGASSQRRSRRSTRRGSVVPTQGQNYRKIHDGDADDEDGEENEDGEEDGEGGVGGESAPGTVTCPFARARLV
jgi:hypothetical protein